MPDFESLLTSDNERLLVDQLIGAQKRVASEILAAGVTREAVIETARHAAWFAQTMASECADPEQPAIACKAKCHWCCNQYVRVTAPEVFRLVAYIDSALAGSARDALIGRLEILAKEADGCSAAERSRLNRACAFLFQGRCVVYEARPLMCSRQTSYKLSDCKKAIARGFPFGAILCERASLLTHSAALQGLSDAYEVVLARGPLAPLELIGATLTALRTPAAFELWRNGDDVFADNHLILGE